MRLLVCNSRSWFSLTNEIRQSNTVRFINRKEELSLELIDEFNPDYIFFPHWNWFVEKDIQQNNKCVVFHTAPLPYGRGGSPIQNLIINGYHTSPVCAISMTSELDAGPIYSSLDVSLDGSLDLIFSRINDAINILIAQIISENPLPRPQVGKPYVFKRLTASDNEIDMGLSIKDIYNRIRMVDHPDYPNAFITLGDLKLEFSNGTFIDDSLEVTCKISKLK